jgi:uncharacterized protein involved in exopolysaccharide biosynthesis
MHAQTTLYEYWMDLYSNKMVIFAVSISAMLFSLLLSTVLPPVYEARSTFYFPTNLRTPTYTSDLSKLSVAQNALLPTSEDKALGVHIGILKSPDIARKAQALFPDKDLKFFQKNIDFAISPEKFFDIYVRDDDPVIAASIANSYINIYEQFHEESISKSARHAETVLENKLLELNKQYADKTTELTEFLYQNSLLSSTDTQVRLTEQASNLEHQININDVELKATHQRILTLHEQLAKERQMYSVDEPVLNNSQIEHLSKRIKDIEIDLAKSPTNKTKADNWKTAELKSQLKKSRSLLKKEYTQLIQSQSKLPNSIHESIRQSLIKQISEEKYLEAKNKALHESLEKIEESIRTSIYDISKLEAITKEKSMIGNMRSDVTNNLIEVRLQREFPTADVVRVRTAEPPENPAFPSPILNSIVALLLGFALGCYNALLLGYLKRIRLARLKRNLDEGPLEEALS